MPVTKQVTALASRWRRSRRWPRSWVCTGGSLEAAVCLGGEHFGDPLPPGTLPRVGFLPWQTTDVGGERGRLGAPTHTGCHLGSRRGWQSPWDSPGAGTAACLGQQPVWGLGTRLAELPLTLSACSTDRVGSWDQELGNQAGRGGWRARVCEEFPHPHILSTQCWRVLDSAQGDKQESPGRADGNREAEAGLDGGLPAAVCRDPGP